MADVLVPVANGAVKRLRDMGDDTHAEVVAAALSLDGVLIEGGGLTPQESAAVQATAAALGTPSDAAATSGTLSAMLRWLLARWPTALVSGRVPVDTGLRGGLSALGYQQLSSISASTALTVPGGAGLAVVQAEGADVRWRDDGVAPTASVGMLLPAGAELRYTGALGSLRLIQASAGAVVNVSYYS